MNHPNRFTNQAVVGKPPEIAEIGFEHQVHALLFKDKLPDGLDHSRIVDERDDGVIYVNPDWETAPLEEGEDGNIFRR
jgi:hypothetical protein